VETTALLFISKLEASYLRFFLADFLADFLAVFFLAFAFFFVAIFLLPRITLVSRTSRNTQRA
jgi:hypothetical protein